MPDIIDFSNQYFYDKKLHIMTAQPKTLRQQHAFLHRTQGKRYKSGYNKIEAQAILSFLKNLFQEERIDSKLSIGIVSPFTAQANHLQRQITKYFAAETLEKHQVLIGTPYSFQGEERDIMLLSFALDNETHPSAFHYLNKEDVFNVSITRAKINQHVFISFDEKHLKLKSLTARFINRLENFSAKNKTSQNATSSNDFLQQVLAIIKPIEPDEILIAFPIAGIEIDIVVLKNNKTYCIDLIGFPGVFEEALSLERWRMLERVGLRIFYLPFSKWHYDTELCKKALLKFLEEERVNNGTIIE